MLKKLVVWACSATLMLSLPALAEVRQLVQSAVSECNADKLRLVRLNKTELKHGYLLSSNYMHYARLNKDYQELLALADQVARNPQDPSIQSVAKLLPATLETRRKETIACQETMHALLKAGLPTEDMALEAVRLRDEPGFDLAMQHGANLKKILPGGIFSGTLSEPYGLAAFHSLACPSYGDTKEQAKLSLGRKILAQVGNNLREPQFGRNLLHAALACGGKDPTSRALINMLLDAGVNPRQGWKSVLPPKKTEYPMDLYTGDDLELLKRLSH